MARLTPKNCQDYLFDDVLWPQRAGEEHDLFAKVLRDHGVVVYLLADLLAETLAMDGAREYLMDNLLLHSYHGSSVENILKQFLNHLSAQELARYLLAGLTIDDTGHHSMGLATCIARPDDFVLPPLPNHLFTRDTSCWIGNGVAINSMAFKARQGETINLATIYKYHPPISSRIVSYLV